MHKINFKYPIKATAPNGTDLFAVLNVEATVSDGPPQTAVVDEWETESIHDSARTPVQSSDKIVRLIDRYFNGHEQEIAEHAVRMFNSLAPD